MLGIIILTGTSFILSIIITIVSILTDKKTNLNESEILNLLPGYNCGACGFGSCKGMASTISNDGINSYKSCPILKGKKLEELENYLINLKK